MKKQNIVVRAVVIGLIFAFGPMFGVGNGVPTELLVSRQIVSEGWGTQKKSIPNNKVKKNTENNVNQKDVKENEKISSVILSEALDFFEILCASLKDCITCEGQSADLDPHIDYNLENRR